MLTLSTLPNITWKAQPGSQTLFLGVEHVNEVIYEGTRGPGKTDALLMCFAQYCTEEYNFGPDWRGIIFRETFAQLDDLVAKSTKWFPRMFPGVKFNASSYTWTWPNGEQLLFRYMRKHSDYDNYHGHAYPFIGWEELTNWADDVCYRKMFSCNRSTNPRIPLIVRSTCNPAGVGHNWVKYRFDLPGSRFIIRKDCVDEDGKPEPHRLAIQGKLSENRILLDANPDYMQKLSASASSEAERRAWLYGDWDVISGGMFDDVWMDAKKYIVKDPFDIPESWRLDRSFDWGSSHPFSVGWWAESDGSDVLLDDGTWMATIPGDLFRIAEWYGCGNKPNTGLKMESVEMARGIIEREVGLSIRGKVKPGCADASIYDTEDGNCIADNMAKKVRFGKRLEHGVKWLAADKSSGSRVNGWEEMRSRFKATIPPKHGIRENPGLFIFSNCKDTLRTIPVLPRDKIKINDVDTGAEDHIADEMRYRVRNKTRKTKIGRTKGM